MYGSSYEPNPLKESAYVRSTAPSLHRHLYPVKKGDPTPAWHRDHHETRMKAACPMEMMEDFQIHAGATRRPYG